MAEEYNVDCNNITTAIYIVILSITIDVICSTNNDTQYDF